MGNLGELGSEVLGTVTDIVDAFGTNIGANADANAVRVESIRLNNQLSAKKAIADEERRQRQEKLIKDIVYFMMFLALIFVIAKTLPKFLKT